MWEQRWHPLRGEWVIVAAHRQNRPWSGQQVDGKDTALPRYDPQCYLCPGNTRIGGRRNPDYAQTFVFDNDLPCVGPDAPAVAEAPTAFYRNRRADGIARVVCFSPRHDVTLAEMSVDQIDAVFGIWQVQYRDLGGRDQIAHVLAFENKGEVVGVSNPHPHGQIYATNFVFKTIENEAALSRTHWRDTGRSLLEDIITAEKQDGRRILFENDSAVAFAPYFARYAYEVYVCPKATHASVADLSDTERYDLAAALKSVLVRLDNLWQMSLPYVLVHHQAPTDGADHAGFGYHIELHPPLRKPNLLKYLAGPEIGGGNFLSDTSPEEKAAELLGLPETHYRHR